MTMTSLNLIFFENFLLKKVHKMKTQDLIQKAKCVHATTIKNMNWHIYGIFI